MVLEENRDLRFVAIVPARKGSKGLARKNILQCSGKPLIQWTIEAATGSRYIDEVVVSTDSEEIRDVAVRLGAWGPFLRCEQLSIDSASNTDVVSDALSRVERVKGDFDYVVLLQPTSPLRTSRHIDEAIECFLAKRKSRLDTLVSVYEVQNKILWAGGVNSDGYLQGHFGMGVYNMNRQQLPNCYMPNGAIYLASAKEFSGFYGGHIIPYVMSSDDSIDIDCKDDFCAAEKLLKKRNK